MERRLRTWVTVAWIAGALLLLWALPEVWRRVSDKPWDGLVDWYGARAFWEGEDPYTRKWLSIVGSEGLGHPPTTSFYALPLALLPLSWMSKILGVITLSMVFAELLILGRMLAVPAPLPTAFLLLALLLHAPFMLYHLGIAQVSALIGFLYFIGWRALRQDREIPAGIALGFACTLKLFPGIMVVYLLIYRRWRAIFVAAITWLVVAAIMTSRFGLQAWVEFAGSEKRIVDYWIGHASNASVQGIVLRLFHPGCQGQSPSDPVASAVAAAISLALLIAFTLLARRAKSFDLPFALFVLLSMFANPFYFEHYNVILILPFALAASALWRAQLPRGQLIAGVVLLVGVIWGVSVPVNSARVLLAWSVKYPNFHLAAHIEEIRTALPTPLLMILSVFLLVKTESRRLSSAETNRSQTAT